MKDEDTGALSGHRAELFEYTGQWVVGVKSYKEAVANEVSRANRLKGYNQWSSTRAYTQEQLAALEGGRYEARYGEGWEAEVRAALAKGDHGVICVTALMDHAIAQGDKLFEGTKYADSWWIYHDHLSAWWEAGAQE